ncbi:hypothetical protein [Novosphingobium colocasiae]|uniref:hypothetical protein n=1 Tax=Novosphingobium colocasiae TaxID=1256513 RepID=UPI0035B08BD5
MNFASILLYPIALLFPAVAGDDGGKDRDAGSPPAAAAPALLPEDAPAMRGLDEVVPAAMTFRSIQPMDSYQIRIEQRMTIRIAPRGAAPMVPDAFVGLPDMTMAPRYLERKMGKCLSMSAIAGMRPQGDNRLLLFLRNGAMVAAELDRACRARDFYSGFYLANSSDGNLCVDRDKLLSRSGANCTLTRIRQLVEDRR